MVNPINKVGAYVIGGSSKLAPVKALAKKFDKDFDKTIGTVTVASIILKDGIGCYKYVTQSLNNKKIPEEKRRFVAALDLTNGVLMIAAQILLFLLMRKMSGPLFNKLFKKSFNPKIKEDIAAKLHTKQMAEHANRTRKTVFDKIYDNNVKAKAMGAFKYVIDLAAATIIGKRVVVPLIATPLASKVEKKMNQNPKFNAKMQEGNENSVEEKKPEQKAIETPVGANLDIVTSSTNLLNPYKHINH